MREWGGGGGAVLIELLKYLIYSYIMAIEMPIIGPVMNFTWSVKNGQFLTSPFERGTVCDHFN